MKKVTCIVRSIGQSIKRHSGKVAAAAVVLAPAAAQAQTEFTTFTASVDDKAELIAAALPGAGAAGLTLFAIWYGIAMIIKTFKTVA